MKRTGKKLSELKSDITLLPQTLLNLKVKHKKPLENLVDYQNAYQAALVQIGEAGRIFVRYSGTEPKIRILIESRDREQNQKIAQELSQVLLKELT